MKEALLIKISETLPPLGKILLLDFENAYTLHNLWIFAAASSFIYLSFLFGDIFLRSVKMNFSSAIQGAVYRIMLGYGFFGLAGLILALSGLFSAVFLRILAVLVISASFRTIAAHLRFLAETALGRNDIFSRFGKIFQDYAALKIIIVFWLFINFFIVFVPVTGWDALDYHLPIMSDIITQRRITFSPLIEDYQNITLLTEVIYAVPMVIFGNIFQSDIPLVFPSDMPLRARIPVFNNSAAPFIFQLLQYSTLIFILLLAYDFLRGKIKNKFFGSVLILSLLSLFDMQREVMHGGYVDMFVFLFGLASTLLIIENGFGAKPRPSELNISAIMLGLALSMKPLALFFLAGNGLFLLSAFWRNKMRWREIIAYVSRYGLIIFAIAGFWYVKNLAWFGNPVYPMFSDPVYGGDVGMFIMERTPMNFFLFPFHLFGQWFWNPDETSSRLIVFGYFVLMYLLAALAVASGRKFTAPEILLFVFIQLYLLLSFLTTHQIRFILPAVIMLPLFLIMLLDKLYAHIKSRWGERVFGIFLKTSYAGVVLAALVLILGNVHYFSIRFNYITGNYTWEKYIEEIGWQ